MNILEDRVAQLEKSAALLGQQITKILDILETRTEGRDVVNQLTELSKGVHDLETGAKERRNALLPTKETNE